MSQFNIKEDTRKLNLLKDIVISAIVQLRKITKLTVVIAVLHKVFMIGNICSAAHSC